MDNTQYSSNKLYCKKCKLTSFNSSNSFSEIITYLWMVELYLILLEEVEKIII